MIKEIRQRGLELYYSSQRNASEFKKLGWTDCEQSIREVAEYVARQFELTDEEIKTGVIEQVRTGQ